MKQSDRLSTVANPRNKLRHFVVTFLGIIPDVCDGGRHFECVAEDMNVEFFPQGSFNDILDYIDFVDATGGSSSSDSKEPESTQEEWSYGNGF
ncbi:MAG: hypothetical protein AAFX06_04275 [Planctomycetota bacterium]